MPSPWKAAITDPLLPSSALIRPCACRKKRREPSAESRTARAGNRQRPGLVLLVLSHPCSHARGLSALFLVRALLPVLSRPCFLVRALVTQRLGFLLSSTVVGGGRPGHGVLSRPQGAGLTCKKRK